VRNSKLLARSSTSKPTSRWKRGSGGAHVLRAIANSAFSISRQAAETQETRRVMMPHYAHRRDPHGRRDPDLSDSTAVAHLSKFGAGSSFDRCSFAFIGGQIATFRTHLRRRANSAPATLRRLRAAIPKPAIGWSTPNVQFPERDAGLWSTSQPMFKPPRRTKTVLALRKYR
jgi:hypothetical protein